MIAEFAQAEFDRRLAYARRQARAGAWSTDQADRKVWPWLAIAIHAGATPQCIAAQLRDDIKAYGSEWTARDGLARDFAAPAEWRAELARARDAAMREDSASWTATSLAILAVYLGAPPIKLPTERMVA